MIRNIEIENVQGTATASIKLGRVTFLVGPNGAGKTSVADAIAFVPLGESPRGGNVAEVIRHGADAAEVELRLDDDERTTLKRRRTPSTGSTWIDGAKVQDKAFDKIIRERIGDPRAIRAAFDARNLFGEKFDLQGFLLSLTGGKLDAEAIAAAMGDDVRAAAKRIGVALPTSLVDFGDEKKGREADARAKRIAAKRALEEREADLARAPAPALDVGERTAAELQAALSQLRAELSQAEKVAAASGAGAVARREQQIADLKAQVAKLEQDVAEARAGLSDVKARAVATIERELSAKRGEAAKLEAHAEALTGQIAKLTAAVAGARADDEEVAKTLVPRSHKREALRKAFGEQADQVKRIDAEGAALGKQLDALPNEPPCLNACKHCAVAGRAAVERDLRAQLDALNSRRVAAVAVRDDAEKKGKEIAQEIALAEAAADRIAAAEGLALARETLARVDGDAKAARTAESVLTKELDTARKVAAATSLVHDREQELDALREELAAAEAKPAPAAPTVDVPALAERVAQGEQFVEAAKARDARAKLLAAAEKARAEVADADLVAKALGKDGVRTELIAAAVRPFTDAANEALAHFAPGWSVEVSTDPFGLVLSQDGAVFRPEQLSDGHRTRLLFVLQYAVARLSGVRFLVFDRAELLDAGGWIGLARLVSECIDQGVQVLVLSHGAPPMQLMRESVAYVVEGGVARRWGAPPASVAAVAGVA